MTTHLTSFYEYKPEAEREGGSRRGIPIAACRRQDGGDQVSIYHDPANEALVDCQDCLDWLNDSDNRLLVSQEGGGVMQWIRNHAADKDIRYIDIPMGDDDDEAEERPA